VEKLIFGHTKNNHQFNRKVGLQRPYARRQPLVAAAKT